MRPPSAGERPARLHVVLDIDETLVHSQQVGPTARGAALRSTLGGHQGTDEFELVLPGVSLWVSKRPGVDGFLRWLRAQGFEVSVYTAGTRVYMEGLLPHLDPEGTFSQRLCREDCIPAPGVHGLFLKDLRHLTMAVAEPDSSAGVEPTDLARTVLVDNNPLSFAMQPENGILVSDWLGGFEQDQEFERVKALLLALEGPPPCRDVREALPQLQGVNLRRLVAEVSERMMLSSL